MIFCLHEELAIVNAVERAKRHFSSGPNFLVALHPVKLCRPPSTNIILVAWCVTCSPPTKSGMRML